MSSSLSTTKFTYEDYVLFPDDGRRHELIDGDHYVTPSPITKHQKISGNLFGSFFIYINETKSGQLLLAPMDVVLSDLDVVQPDLLFISNKKDSIITEKIFKAHQISQLKFYLTRHGKLMKSSNENSTNVII